MKIKDWEDFIMNKFGGEKLQNFQDAIKFYADGSFKLKNNLKFYCAYNYNDELLFICSNDGQNIDKTLLAPMHQVNGVYKNEWFDLRLNYFYNHKKFITSITEFEEYFYKNYKIKKLFWNDLSKSQKKLYKELLLKQTTFCPEMLTENNISSSDFYGIYYFDDAKITNNILNHPVNTGFNTTFIVLASKNQKDISDYYIMQSGKIPKNEFNFFVNEIISQKLNSGVSNE